MALLISIKKYIAKISLSKKKYCCICGRSSSYFLPYRGGWKTAPQLSKTLHIVGSDLDQFSCVHCGSHDRERHLLLYLHKMDILSNMRGAMVLHFAPEPQLSIIINNQMPAKYIKGDLFPAAPGIEKIDIQNIPYPSKSFDFILANHILEHVDDDIKALRELFRVLKPGGTAILQTPYSAKLHHTFSDPGINCNEARYQVYGQEDHVRLYGRDIVERFTSVGFISKMANHKELLLGVDASRFGVNTHEPLFLFERPDSQKTVELDD